MPDQLTENDLRKYCVTYNGDTAVEKVRAAYFVQDGDLITFKNHDHKAVMAVRRDVVISVRDTTDDERVNAQSEQIRDRWVDHAVVDSATGTITLDGEPWPYAIAEGMPPVVTNHDGRLYTIDVRIPVLKSVDVVNGETGTRYAVGPNL
jgi:hypothetical protein